MYDVIEEFVEAVRSRLIKEAKAGILDVSELGKVAKNLQKSAGTSDQDLERIGSDIAKMVNGEATSGGSDSDEDLEKVGLDMAGLASDE